MKYILPILLLSVLALAACTVPQGTAATIQETTKQNTANNDMDTQGAAMTKPINVEASTFTFEGFAPGKSHVGTFDEWNGELHYDANGNIIGASGVIQTASVNTGIENLDGHLRSDDFFITEMHPTITVTSTALADGMMTADVTFIGTTKSVSFPVTVTENGLSAGFLLDTTPFGMKYVAVNKDVKIIFDVVAQ